MQQSRSTHIERLDTLDAYFSLADDVRAAISLLILDEDIVSDIAGLDVEMRLRLRKIPIAMAYLDARTPRAVLASRELSPVIRSYLPMNVRFDVLIAIIRLLIDGGVYIPQEVRSPRQVNELPATDEESDGDAVLCERSRLRALSPREMEVLGLISKGEQNKCIAAQLKLSEHTVKLHIHNIINKLHVNNRTGAAALFLAGE
ncbi:MAG: response regulator transcription factor [Paracoccaceae bacterium]|nr:response regulator transcription factor [Paracoccaceae bacterium]